MDTVAQSVIDGWDNGLWAACITAGIGAVGFCMWAPGRSNNQNGTIAGKFEEGALHYSDVSKVLRVEGVRSRTSVTVHHRVVRKNKKHDG